MSKFNRKKEETESKLIPLAYRAVLAHGHTLGSCMGASLA